MKCQKVGKRKAVNSWPMLCIAGSCHSISPTANITTSQRTANGSSIPPPTILPSVKKPTSQTEPQNYHQPAAHLGTGSGCRRYFPQADHTNDARLLLSSLKYEETDRACSFQHLPHVLTSTNVRTEHNNHWKSVERSNINLSLTKWHRENGRKTTTITNICHIYVKLPSRKELTKSAQPT